MVVTTFHPGMGLPKVLATGVDVDVVSGSSSSRKPERTKTLAEVGARQSQTHARLLDRTKLGFLLQKQNPRCSPQIYYGHNPNPQLDDGGRTAWLAGFLPILLASLPFPALTRFSTAVLGFAKRGKTMHHTSNKFTVPQRFFLHFYVVAVAWTTFLLLLTWLYAHKMTSPTGLERFHYSAIASHLTGGSHILSFKKSKAAPATHSYRIWRAVLLLLMMEIQVLRRLYETWNVFNYSPSARMHIFGYLTGLFFLAPEMSKYAANLLAEVIVMGKDHLADFDFDWREFVKPLTKLGLCQWIGLVVFLWGSIHQYRCHAILGSLRELKEKVDEYVIPRGDWFEIVSSPHYLAEIVSNLVFAAAETQRWYQHCVSPYEPLYYDHTSILLPYLISGINFMVILGIHIKKEAAKEDKSCIQMGVVDEGAFQSSDPKEMKKKKNTVLVLISDAVLAKSQSKRRGVVIGWVGLLDESTLAVMVDGDSDAQYTTIVGIEEERKETSAADGSRDPV
ncbi:hypothetical protein ACLOJK_024787 [Asimina triloba]